MIKAAGILEKAIQHLYRIRILSPLKPVLETLEGIVLGSRESTVAAPHLRDHIEIKRYMSAVILALIPSTVSAIVIFGWHALWMIAVSYVVGGIIEVLFALIRKKDIEEGFLVTGLIFPLILPPTTPLWVVAVGISFGVFFGKEVFGGTGRNIFNPALVGRLFVTIAFPGILSASWLAPFTDAITSATPLSVFNAEQALTPYLDLLFGRAAGSMGEIFRIGILAGGIFLMLTRVSNWRVPVAYLATVALISFVGSSIAPDAIAPPLFQLLSGGLLFGAMFMATDPVTSPITAPAKWAYGIFIGCVTLLIRSLTVYTEGVMFAILLGNIFGPLFDEVVFRFRFRRYRLEI